MLSLWLENQTPTLREIAQPTPPVGEALIRILKAGVCNTDIELTRGYYPYRGVLGHEFVGVVESAGEWQGARVCGEINAVCGQCESCRAGRPTHCDSRTVLGIVNREGVFAEYTTLPYENLHRVPEVVSDEAAVFTEPLAAACEILQQVHIRPTDRVYVIGDGKLGLLCAQVVALTGCHVTAIGKHTNKLEILAQRGLRTALIDSLPTQRADVVIECTGSPAGFETARRLLRPRGTLVLKSTYAGLLTVNMSSVVVDEITLLGSRCGPFAPALDLLARQQVDVLSLIHARYPLAHAVEALEYAQRPGVLKVIIDCGH